MPSSNCVVTLGLTLGVGEPRFNDKFKAEPFTRRPAAVLPVAGLNAELSDAVLELKVGLAGFA